MQETTDNALVDAGATDSIGTPNAGSGKATGKKAKTEAKKVRPAAKAKQAFMYLGPNIPGGILFSGSVYKQMPKYLDEVLEKLPEAKALFVEVKDAPGVKAKLNQQGSEAHGLYQTIERLIREGALKNGDV